MRKTRRERKSNVRISKELKLEKALLQDDKFKKKFSPGPRFEPSLQNSAGENFPLKFKQNMTYKLVSKMKLSLTEVIEKRLLAWFGHAFCMTEERKIKQVMEMREGRIRRARARPRIIWEDIRERMGQQRAKTMA